MLVTIITVCLNAGSKISNTIKSVCDQSYNEIEYIIIDGGSTDNTLNILQKYSNCIHAFVTEKDKGIYDAMNKGLSMASGEVVYFLNADDQLANENVVANIMREFKSSSELDILYGDVIFDKVEIDKNRQSNIPMTRKTLASYMFNHQSIFTRRNVFVEEGGFDVDKRVVSDRIWLYKVINTHKYTMKYIDIVISTVGSDGVTFTDDWGKEKQDFLHGSYSLLELTKWRYFPILVSKFKMLIQNK